MEVPPVVWLVLVLAAPLAQAFCVPKTDASDIYLYRQRLGCRTANPTSCTCISQPQNPSSCPARSTTLWASDGQQCITVTPDKDQNGAKHDWFYPSSYGSTCGSTSVEVGSFACTALEDVSATTPDEFVYLPHAFKEGHPGYNTHANSTAWCTHHFCWVDPCTCNHADIHASTWMDAYYSYTQCGSVDTYSGQMCLAHTTKAECLEDDHCKLDLEAELLAAASGVVAPGISMSLSLFVFCVLACLC